MEQNTELVSIIIPAYNAERFIAETINSVLKQTYVNWELIIINDGSKDTTEEVVQQFLSDKRINYFKKENGGVSEARNSGISKVRGNLIAFLDADDVWLPDNLTKKVNFLQKNNDVDFVYSNMLEADVNLQNQTLAPVGKDNNIFEDLLLWNGEVIPGPSSNLLLRKKCIDSGIRFDKTLSTIADQNISVQLASKFRGALIKEALFIYRVIPGSMSKSIKVMEKDALATYAIYLKNGYFKSASFKNKCFANMYLILAGSFFKLDKNFIKGSKYLLLAIKSLPFYVIKKLFIKLIKKAA